MKSLMRMDAHQYRIRIRTFIRVRTLIRIRICICIPAAPANGFLAPPLLQAICILPRLHAAA